VKVSVRYFAALRDQRGLAAEVIDTEAETPCELYGVLQARHGLSLPPSQVRFAVNGQYVDANEPMKGGDEVVFIPPVAGG
jgi:molybdopterin converting factor subunit 1